MKVSICEKCKHCRRRAWRTYYKPNNYHAIGISHAYAYCEKHKERCLKIKECLEGQVENKNRFEKGVGVSIETFIKIITDGFYYKKGKDVFWESNAVFIGNGYCRHSNSMVKTHFLYSEFDHDNQKSIADQHYWDWAKKEDVFNFEDYGKTWSINREDLIEEDK